MSFSDFDYILRIKEFWCKFEDYIKDEEGYDLFVFEEKLIFEYFEFMVKSFGWIKYFVFSCSYFLVGEYFLFELVVGLFIVLIDCFIDLFCKFLEKGEEVKLSGLRIDILLGSNVIYDWGLRYFERVVCFLCCLFWCGWIGIGGWKVFGICICFDKRK